MSPEILAWLALLTTLGAVAHGHRRFDAIAFGALLVLGAVGVAPRAVLFSGFSHPAVITIVALFVVGEAVSVSGVLLGLGRQLERRWSSPKIQVVGLASVTGLLSAFINNVAALSLVLPTAGRMAERARVSPGRFGLPLAFASILGGTLTLAGSAPNIIVSGFRSTSFGAPFRMFDFLPHGLAICAAGLCLWWLGERSGRQARPTADRAETDSNGQTAGVVPLLPAATEHSPGPVLAPLGTARRRLCLAVLGLAVVLVSVGALPPSVGFGLAAVALVLVGVIELPEAYAAIDLRVVVFLGSMLSLGEVLGSVGALDRIAALAEPLASGLSRWWLLAAVFAASSLLSNILNNAAAAILMAPVAVGLAATNAHVGPDASLMCVAAGACLALVLPTHQATLMTLGQAPFDLRRMRKAGLLLTLGSGIAAVSVVSLLWA